MHRRGRPRIRRVAAKHSVPKGERIDEFPAQPAVPEGDNLNATQMAEVLAAAL
ncbi:hypothetical protein ACOSQ3_003164 [Xanthoceras sorbifolium]